MTVFCFGNQGLELSCRYVDLEIIGAGSWEREDNELCLGLVVQGS